MAHLGDPNVHSCHSFTAKRCEFDGSSWLKLRFDDHDIVVFFDGEADKAEHIDAFVTAINATAAAIDAKAQRAADAAERQHVREDATAAFAGE